MDDQYCTFCNDYINKDELTFTEDAEPVHVKCLNNFQQHWDDRDEAFDLLGFNNNKKK